MQAIKNFISPGGSQAVHLYNYCLWKEGGEDEQWAHKAIEYIVKKLRKKKGALEDLEYAVTNPDKRSKCVTIPRSADGRLQVSHRKNLPHVIYCKVWRWPDIHSHHELRPVTYCMHPFEPFKATASSNHSISTSTKDGTVNPLGSGNKNNINLNSTDILPQVEVCINPYHYERIQVPAFPPILVPRVPMNSTLALLQSRNESTAGAYSAGRYHPYAPSTLRNAGDFGLSTDERQNCIRSNVLSSQQPACMPGNNGMFGQSNFADFRVKSGAGADRNAMDVEESGIHTADLSSSTSYQPDNSMPTGPSLLQENFHQNPSSIPSPGMLVAAANGCQQQYTSDAHLHSPAPSTLSSVAACSPQSQHSDVQGAGSDFSAASSGSSPTSGVAGDGFASPPHSSASSPSLQHHNQQQNSFARYYGHERSPSDEQQRLATDSSPNNSNNTTQPPPEVTVVPFQTIEMWCKITYYELNVRVGDPFHTSKHVLVVDGYTAHTRQNEGRFCLGNLSQVARNNTIEQTRRFIGRGIQLSYVGGNVTVECLSDCAVFVQSRLCNYQNSFHPTTVCKIPTACALSVFSLQHFAELLRQTVRFGYEACYELTKMCFIRISFVKGWGSEYSRQDITSCPCWIEVVLEEPLRWLDRVLRQMDPPSARVTSVS